MDKESACDARDTGDVGWVPGLGTSPEEGHGTLLQYSCLENPMGKGAWRATVQNVVRSQARLNDYTLSFKSYPVLPRRKKSHGKWHPSRRIKCYVNSCILLTEVLTFHCFQYQSYFRTF